MLAVQLASIEGIHFAHFAKNKADFDFQTLISTLVDSTEGTSSGTKVSLGLSYPKEGVVCDTLIVTANVPSGDNYRIGVPLCAIVLASDDESGEE